MCKELDRLLQGHKSTEGTNAYVILTLGKIKLIPKDRTVTYAQIVVDYRTMKSETYRVWITVGGNLIRYPGDVTTKTADITIYKLLWNSILLTPDA